MAALLITLVALIALIAWVAVAIMMGMKARDWKRRGCCGEGEGRYSRKGRIGDVDVGLRGRAERLHVITMQYCVWELLLWGRLL